MTSSLNWEESVGREVPQKVIKQTKKEDQLKTLSGETGSQRLMCGPARIITGNKSELELNGRVQK